jgi:hypothetical protein
MNPEFVGAQVEPSVGDHVGPAGHDGRFAGHAFGRRMRAMKR